MPVESLGSVEEVFGGGKFIIHIIWDAENAGRENDGRENAGHKNAGMK